MLDLLETELQTHGLCLTGGFHPTPGELGATQTVLLIGNAGSAMWHRLEPAPQDPAEHAIDEWTRQTLTALAKQFDAGILFPFDGPPYAPFVSWSFRTGQCHKSRLGMAIHARFGLWFALRGALLFSEHLEFGTTETTAPCDTCSDKPCISACPVGAFDGGDYAYQDCRAHVALRPNDCSNLGCAARRACPVGQAFQYDADHAAYHMRSFAPVT